MSKNQYLLFKPATELASLIKKGEVTSQQVVSAHLEQIKKHNHKIHAIVTLRAQEALDEARKADEVFAQGKNLGVLHGVPITIKDACRIEGIRSTFGALPQYFNHSPKSDCEIIRRLRQSGAIILGRTNTPLLSMDWQCGNLLFKECVNPWNAQHVPGGSSGGSAAAVAAGFTPLEIGSDIAGSIRYPAHCCGILGLRTTDGLLPIEDIGPEKLPPVFQRLMTCGPMARNIKDLKLLLNVLSESERDQNPKSTSSNRKLKIAFSTSLLGLTPNKKTLELMSHLQNNLIADGHEVHFGIQPPINYAEAYHTGGIIAGHEFKEVLPPLLRTSLGRLLFDSYILHFKLGRGPLTDGLKKGMSSSRQEYENSLKKRELDLSIVDSFFNDYDLWILPVSPSEAIPRQWGGRPILAESEKITYSKYLGSYLAPTTYLGTPALTIPIGFGESGLPIAVQVHSARFSDHWLLEIAEKFLSQYQNVKIPPGFELT